MNGAKPERRDATRMANARSYVRPNVVLRQPETTAKAGVPMASAGEATVKKMEYITALIAGHGIRRA